MGVHGLWKLIESAGKPVPVETLENKVLAVDVSIWLHQLMKGYQTPTGSSVSNAYLLGLFTRVCKLLFTNVKPVFVFDGGVPQLKKKTIAARQQQKSKSAQASEKLRQQLLKNLLKQKAVGQVLEEIRGQSSPKKKERDMFELPPMPEDEDSLSEVEEMSNSSSEEDVKPIKMRFKDLHTIDVKSAEFKDLPADMRHDILTELKETRKQNSWGRIHEMPEELGDFSKYQMSRLLKRRSVQVSLEEAEKEMGGRTLSLNDVEALLAEGGVEINPQLTKRIASDDVTRYIYVRETGKQPNQEAIMKILSNEKENSSQVGSSSFNSNVKIKEEIIDCDELSDSELLKEVEAIEMAHIANNIKKEENVEFGTEDMYEDDTSSEGVIMDDMDLIKDTSGLSQEQILAIIRRENKDKNSFSDENIPSTSKEDNTFQEEILKTDYSTIDVLSNEKITDLSDTSKQNESNILESLYFKINQKKIKSALTENSKHIIYNDNNKILNATAPGTKTDKNGHTLGAPSDLPSESVSETDTIQKLPCEVSFLELPKTTSKLVLKQSSVAEAGINKALITTQSSKKIDDTPFLSDSESDNEFVEVPASTGEVSSLNNQVLEIQIQTTQEKIQEDIFADIFVTEKTNKTSVGSEVTQSIKGFQTEPLPYTDKKSSRTDRKENAQSLALPSLKIKNKQELTVKNETSNVAINRENKKPESFQDVQKLNYASQESTKCVGDLPLQTQAVQKNNKNTHSSQVKKQITTQVNKKCVLVSQLQKPTSLEITRDLNLTQTQDNSSQKNKKYRQSLYTQKQGNQINIQTTKTKTAKEIFSSIFDDDDSDKETVDEVESLSLNEEFFENEEFKNKSEMEKEIVENEELKNQTVTEMEKEIDESSFESESFESVNIRLDKTPSPTNPALVSNEEESIYEQNKEPVTPHKTPSRVETNIVNEEQLSIPVSPTEEGQLSFEQGFEDGEDVHDPRQRDDSDDPPFSKDIEQSKKPKRMLDLRQLEKLQDILETKERELVVDQNREDRIATSLTDQMYQEAQELLRLFGVPYIVAPMEAEAQCAFLDGAGLTEGTITDDSDIWLFGGRKVYKNFFDQKKFVLEFQSGDIQQYFKLARSHLVLLALLVGSDYTVGLTGVGPVTALEILSTFPLSSPDSRDTHELLLSLTRFREWWRARPETHTALAKKLRNVDLHDGFPSPAVVSAYLNPLVDDSREPFAWGSPDVAALRDYAERKFGWSRSRTDQVLLPAVNKLSQRTSQLTLHTFFGAIPNISAHREQMSRRVQSAVNRLEGGSEAFTPLEPRSRPPRGRGGSRGGRGRGRAAAPLETDEELPFPGVASKVLEVIPQREKDKAEATKRKQLAIEVLKNKKQRGIKKRRNVRQTKPEANLSESSSDDN